MVKNRQLSFSSSRAPGYPDGSPVCPVGCHGSPAGCPGSPAGSHCQIHHLFPREFQGLKHQDWHTW